MTDPSFRQETEWTCSAAALRAALAAFGIRKSEASLARTIGVSRRWGAEPRDVTAAVERLGCDYRVGRRATPADLRRRLAEGAQVLVAYYVPAFRTGHFALVTAVTATHVVLADPWFGPGRRVPLARFRSLWKSNGRASAERGWYLALYGRRG